jgi:hypothetical protein
MSREDKAETWRILNEPPSPKFRITKTVVKAKSRKLKATWNVEKPQELESEFGADVEKEVLNILLRGKK